MYEFLATGGTTPSLNTRTVVLALVSTLKVNSHNKLKRFQMSMTLLTGDCAAAPFEQLIWLRYRRPPTEHISGNDDDSRSVAKPLANHFGANSMIFICSPGGGKHHEHCGAKGVHSAVALLRQQRRIQHSSRQHKQPFAPARDPPGN